jgi:hypothetical protein
MNNLPALQGMTDDEKAQAIKSVRWKVLKHWQASAPLALWILSLFLAVFLTGTFPWKRLVIIGGGCLMGMFAVLPSNHYAQEYLSKEMQSKSEEEKSEPR